MADPTQEMTDPAVAPVDDAAADTSGGFCIEIKVSSSGEIKVGVESLADEQSEEGGESADEYQTVGSFGEALRLAKEIFTHAGSMADAGASQDEMSAGYGKAGA